MEVLSASPGAADVETSSLSGGDTVITYSFKGADGMPQRNSVTVRDNKVYVYFLALEGDLIFNAAQSLRTKCRATIVTEDQVIISR